METIIPNRLREYREKRGWTVFQFAERANVDDTTIRRVENGHPSVFETVAKVCNTLRLPREQVFPNGFNKQGKSVYFVPTVKQEEKPIVKKCILPSWLNVGEKVKIKVDGIEGKRDAVIIEKCPLWFTVKLVKSGARVCYPYMDAYDPTEIKEVKGDVPQAR